jgi:hypothetical protein
VLNIKIRNKSNEASDPRRFKLPFQECDTFHCKKRYAISMAGCLIRSTEDRKIDEIVAYKNINQDR